MTSISGVTIIKNENGHLIPQYTIDTELILLQSFILYDRVMYGGKRDPLTGMYERPLCLERIDAALANSRHIPMHKYVGGRISPHVMLRAMRGTTPELLVVEWALMWQARRANEDVLRIEIIN